MFATKKTLAECVKSAMRELFDSKYKFADDEICVCACDGCDHAKTVVRTSGKTAIICEKRMQAACADFVPREALQAESE